MKHLPRPIITVTQDIIDRAVPRDSARCVIADSLRMAVPGATTVAVDRQTIRYTDKAKGERYIYLTPKIARDVLLDFDEGIKPPPVQFQLSRPVQVLPYASPKQREETKRAIAAGEKKGRVRARMEFGVRGSDATIIGGDRRRFKGRHDARRRRIFGQREGGGFAVYKGVSRVAEALDRLGE